MMKQRNGDTAFFNKGKKLSSADGHDPIFDLPEDLKLRWKTAAISILVFELIANQFVTSVQVTGLLNDSEIQKRFITPLGKAKLSYLAHHNKEFCEAILASTICENYPDIKKSTENTLTVSYATHKCKTQKFC